MASRLTIHSNVAKDRARSLEFARSSNSSSVYFLDPDTAAIDIVLNETNKDVHVRIFDPLEHYQGGRNKTFDNDYHNLVSVDTVFSWLVNSEYKKYRGNKRVRFIVGMNEPSNNSVADLSRGINWAAYWGKLCATNQFGALMGGFNIAKSLRLINTNKGSALAPDVDEGIWDILLQVAHEYPEWVIIDEHDYAPFREWYQYVNDPYNQAAMLNPPTQATISWQRTEDGQYPPNWYMGRSAPLIIRCEEKGYDRAQFGVGECPVDNMSDNADIINEVADRFTRPGFESQRIRGIRSLRNLFAFWNNIAAPTYTDNEFGADAFRGVLWMLRVYPSKWFRYFAYYAGNSNPDWMAYAKNISEAQNVFHDEMRPLYNLIAAHNEAVQELPDMTLETKLVRSTSASGTNLRDTPSGRIVGKLTLEPIRAEVSNETQLFNGYQWRIIIIDSKEYYAADKFIIIDDIPETPTIPNDETIKVAVQAWFDENFDDELYLHVGADGSIPRSVMRSMIRIKRAMLLLVEDELDSEDNV